MRALIFDVDGTLAETEEAHRAAFNAAFSGAGLDWHWDTTLYGELLRVTGGKERMRHYMAAYRSEEYDPEERVKLAADLHRSKTAHYETIMARGGVRLRPGIGALIQAARREGVTMAIATTTSPANVTALLNAAFGADSLGCFAVIAAGDCVAAKKPAPDIYEVALAGLGLPAAACLAIEDSRNGILSAAGAGIPVIATPSLYTQGERRDEAALDIPSLLALGTSGAKILARLKSIHLSAIGRTTRKMHRLAS